MICCIPPPPGPPLARALELALAEVPAPGEPLELELAEVAAVGESLAPAVVSPLEQAAVVSSIAATAAGKRLLGEMMML
ncbi:MAG TPA: hypothetical protein VF635_11180, partial [Propionibacteriaceae bacterium]